MVGVQWAVGPDGVPVKAPWPGFILWTFAVLCLVVGAVVLARHVDAPSPTPTAEPTAKRSAAPCCAVVPDLARAHEHAADLFKRLGAELDGEIVCTEFPDRIACSAFASGHLVTLACDAQGCRP